MKIPDKKPEIRNPETKLFMACMSKQLKDMRSDYTTEDFDAQFTGALKFVTSLDTDCSLDALWQEIWFKKEEMELMYGITNKSYIPGICKLLARTFAHYYTVKYKEATR